MDVEFARQSYGDMDFYYMQDDDSDMEEKPNCNSENERPEDRRHHERLKCKKMTCCLGEVVDISQSGMQIMRRGRQLIKIDDVFDAQLHYDTGFVSLRTQVVWVRKLGFRNWAFGIQFIESSTDAQTQLQDLIGTAREEFTGPQLWIAA
ncbi:PilZ domain-containing protein [Poriferisphaera sp. WC338]|uniref:PilZ domain-containing protein n=1 Tax=Poriferisphaera sp. WC338 TaxID=3425129 RepID=UPI003D8125EE